MWASGSVPRIGTLAIGFFSISSVFAWGRGVSTCALDEASFLISWTCVDTRSFRFVSCHVCLTSRHHDYYCLPTLLYTQLLSMPNHKQPNSSHYPSVKRPIACSVKPTSSVVLNPCPMTHPSKPCLTGIPMTLPTYTPKRSSDPLFPQPSSDRHP